MTTARVTSRSKTTSIANATTIRRRRPPGSRASASLGAAEPARQERQLGVGVVTGLGTGCGEPDARGCVRARVAQLPVQRRAQAVGVRAAQVTGRARGGVVERAQPHDAGEPVEVER